MTAAPESAAAILARLGVAVTELVNDSRKTAPGVVFVAYPGAARDGRDFIRDAVEHRVDGVLWEAEGYLWPADFALPNAGVAGLRERLGEIAAEVYGQPSGALLTFGVTGTNGKTSVAHWIAQALTQLGRKTAVLGTVGNGFPGHLSPARNTTPDAIELQQRLAHFRRDGAQGFGSMGRLSQSDLVAAQACQLGFIEQVQGFVLDVNLAPGGAVDPAQQVQQGGLAAAAGAIQDGKRPSGQAEIDPAQSFYEDGTLAVSFIDLVRAHQRGGRLAH